MRRILAATSAIMLIGAGTGFAQDGIDILPDLNLAQNECVRVQPGTGQFEPSNLNDDPHPDFVDTECPEFAAGAIAPGAVEDGDRVRPGVGQFEPANLEDEPTPEFVQEQGIDRSLMTATIDVSPDAIDYVERYPTESVTFDGDLTVGATLGADVGLTPVPDHPYAYFYADQRPVLVDPNTRTIMWVG